MHRASASKTKSSLRRRQPDLMALTEELKRRFGKVKLIALDLDGTTLTDDKRITPDVGDAIRRAKDAGYVITFVTGRMFGATAPFARALNLDIPIVCMNGTLIAEAHTGKILYEQTLTKECAKEVLNSVNGAPIHQFLYEGDNICHRVKDPDILKYLEWWAVNLKEVDEFSLQKYKKIYQLIFIGELTTLKKIALDLNAQTDCDIVTFSYPSPRYPLHFLEIKSPGDSKGGGLRFLRERYGYSKEETLAVGDYANDFELLEEAGVSVAIANAMDELKQKADYISELSNEESGVAQLIDLILQCGVKNR